MSRLETLAINQVAALLNMIQAVETENEALRVMLGERGVRDEELQDELTKKTQDPAIREKVRAMIAPIVEGMPAALKQIATSAMLEQWKPKGPPT